MVEVIESKAFDCVCASLHLHLFYIYYFRLDAVMGILMSSDGHHTMLVCAKF